MDYLFSCFRGIRFRIDQVTSNVLISLIFYHDHKMFIYQNDAKMIFADALNMIAFIPFFI